MSGNAFQFVNGAILPLLSDAAAVAGAGGGVDVPGAGIDPRMMAPQMAAVVAAAPPQAAPPAALAQSGAIRPKDVLRAARARARELRALVAQGKRAAVELERVQRMIAAYERPPAQVRVLREPKAG